MSKTHEVLLMPITVACMKCYLPMIVRTRPNATMPKGLIIVSCSNNSCVNYDVDVALTLPTATGTEVDSCEILYDQVMSGTIAAGATYDWKKHEYRPGKWIKLPEPEAAKSVGEKLLSTPARPVEPPKVTPPTKKRTTKKKATGKKK
jgi:hypothetical protein